MRVVKPYPNDEFISRYLCQLNNVHHKYGVLLLLGLETGCRISDLLNVQAKQIQSEMRIREQKTGKRRIVTLSPECLRCLETYCGMYRLGRNDYLVHSLPRHKDKPLSRMQAYRVLKRVATALGRDDLGTHSMRKTFALRVFRKTKSLEAVRKALNHKYIDTTLRYVLDFDSIDELIKI